MTRFVQRRRAFLSTVAGIGLGAMTGPGARAIAQPGISGRSGERAKAPNIIFILADDLGYADVSCFGTPGFTTPSIDRIAHEGIKLTRAYANSAVCSATRTALITGRYQDRIACGLEEPIASSSGKIGLPPGLPTLPGQLHRAGYRTALVGKWHLGSPPEFGPLKSGYDHFYGISGGAADYFTHQGKPGENQFYRDDHLIHDHGYLTGLLGDEAVRLVDTFAQDASPFFLSLHFNAPHWPWEGPEDEAESKRLKGKIFDYDGGTQKTYGRMVRAMDDQIGRVLATLDRHQLTENTIVVFTSDNGGERFSEIWPFTGMKGELLEGGLRVPAVLRWPARVRAGSESDQTLITMDWLPSFLAAAGVTPDATFPSDGTNLLPFLGDPEKRQSRSLFWRYKIHDQHAHLDGDYKYLKIGENEFLFDVVSDPRERANLKDRKPELFARLKKEWAAWNATMLPFPQGSYSWGADAQDFADHYDASRSD
ncbi:MULTISPECIES: sulfatase family protein [Gluconobacter]|uniref:Sulfatase-like hydrolase/transferase n=1 Tax=Gluconobacter cadivus TaxID=2728101 RepID=A0ABR9YXR2_9PROT|nr:MULTISPECIES: sulfatase-like hydrolase/transferase [Gluconobacter]MBF0888667.1 sulfatase-like hydrolase/transferase [Gluconobacter cadivus]MBS1059994.1 sulfatase-like hydrolase/transferase [Gluconobacter sp. Dm-44]